MTRTLANMMLVRSPLTNAPYSPDKAGDFLLPRLTLVAVDALAAVGERFERAVHAIERRGKRREAIRELRALDDRILSDIGVHRSQIPAVVDAALDRQDADPFSAARVKGHLQS